jgi:hypothetical protein
MILNKELHGVPPQKYMNPTHTMFQLKIFNDEWSE